MKNILDKIIENDKNWRDPDFCLVAVKADSDNLRFVKKQTPEICMTAIKKCLCTEICPKSDTRNLHGCYQMECRCVAFG